VALAGAHSVSAAVGGQQMTLPVYVGALTHVCISAILHGSLLGKGGQNVLSENKYCVSAIFGVRRKRRLEMTTTKHPFAFRIDIWTPDGESILEQVALVEDYQVALATYRAACQCWPGTSITLRQGARVIEDSRRLRTV
jgi:hypothetical protein